MRSNVKDFCNGDNLAKTFKMWDKPKYMNRVYLLWWNKYEFNRIHTFDVFFSCKVTLLL